MATRFSTIPFGEKCDKHPPMKPRGMDNRTQIFAPTRSLTNQELQSQHKKNDWFRHDVNINADREAVKRQQHVPQRPYATGTVPVGSHSANTASRSIAHQPIADSMAERGTVPRAAPGKNASSVPLGSFPSQQQGHKLQQQRPSSATIQSTPQPVSTQPQASTSSALDFTKTVRPGSAAVPPTRSNPHVHSVLPNGMDGCAPPKVVDRVVAKVIAPPPRDPPQKPLTGYDAHLKQVELDSKVDDVVMAMKRHVVTKTNSAPLAQQARYLQNMLKQFVPATSVTNQATVEMTPEMFGKAVASGFNGLQLSNDVRDATFDRFDLNENGSVSFKEFADSLFDVKTNGKPSGAKNDKVRKIIADIKMKALSRNRGDNAVRAITNSFRTINKNKDATLTKEELFNGLQKIRVRCTLAECQAIVEAFDRGGDGKVSQQEFLRAFRGTMLRRRRLLVQKAYNILDANNDQTVTLDEIGARYNATQHPAVLSGEMTEEEVLKDFIQGWDSSGDAIITWQEFLSYYKDISAGIANDDYFELMMRNCWHISGGEGWCANTTCRRVLVTFEDDRQSVEEIKDDLGIGPNDIGKMKERLEQQGLTGIKSIELYS